MRIGILDNSQSDINNFRDVINSIQGVTLVSSHMSLVELTIHFGKNCNLDYLFLDIYLDNHIGVELISKIKKLYQNVEIIMFSKSENATHILDSIKKGACGYLLKDDSYLPLRKSLEIIFKGGSFVSPKVARHIIHSNRKSLGLYTSNKLSKKEIQTLELLAQGWTYDQIASDLNLTLDGVRTRVRRIYKKLHVKNKMQAIMKLKNYW